ncbi:hypothetical protein Droror1_Dr00005766, partial [Drosera rotundifolia]
MTIVLANAESVMLVIVDPPWLVIYNIELTLIPIPWFLIQGSFRSLYSAWIKTGRPCLSCCVLTGSMLMLELEHNLAPATLVLSLSAGHVVGNFSHEAFAIGGTNSVRGYEEVGSSRWGYFADYGTDLGSGHLCL